MAPFDYTTPVRVFAYGNSAGTATDPVNEAAEMAIIVTGMSRAIDTYCNQAFSLESYSNQVLRAVVDVEGVLTCYPPVPTMSTPTAASWRQARSSSWVDLDEAQLDLEVNPFGCVARVLDQDYSPYRGGRLQMRLSYSGGYANLAALSADFVLAMDALCWWAYQKRSAPIDKTAIPEMGMLIIPSNWPGHIKQMFRSYVRQVPM